MKRAKPGKRSSRATGKGRPLTVEEYVAATPKLARPVIDQLRATIRSVVPKEATEVISYGIPAFRHNGILVWFAAFSEHCSLFPTAAVIEAFKRELQGYSTSKGTIHFPIDKPLPTVLIKKIVKARVAGSESKKRR
jgi:uncharacterized protein YdhG (YjbR/CyaY superfamily)